MNQEAFAVELTFLDMSAQPGKSQQRAKVSLDKFEEFDATHNYVWIDKVWFRKENGEEFWTYGKSWQNTRTGKTARIGAGSYGDLTVWQRSLECAA